MNIEADDMTREVTHWFKLTDADVIVRAMFSDFRPARLVVTFRTFVTSATGETDGPSWRATLIGPIVKKDGSPSKREAEVRYWESHSDVPEWLRAFVSTIGTVQ